MTASKPNPASSASPSVKNAGPDAGGIKKKKKQKRVRGEKPRYITILRQHERKPQVSRKGRSVRNLDLAPRPRDESALPRGMRAMFAAKAKIEAKQTAAASAQTAAGGASAAGSGAVGGPSKRNGKGGKEKAGEGTPEISAKTGKRKTAREIVIETVRKTSHQHEKRKAYHVRRQERVTAKKERAKQRRRTRRAGDGDSSSGEDNVDGDRMGPDERVDNDKKTQSPRFGEQAMAPPKLVPVVKRSKK